MLDIGWPELLVIAIVLIVVVGPKDLPGMMRNFAKGTKKLRVMAGDFRSQFDDALKEAELDDVKDLVNTARDLNPAKQFKNALDPLNKIGNDVKADFNSIMRDTKPAAKPAMEPTPETKPVVETKAPVQKPAAKKPAAKKPAPKTTAAKKPAAKKADEA